MNAPPQPPDNAAGLRQQVLDWFVRRQREAWSAQDEQAFVQWLQADARHRSAYRQWEQHSAALDAMPADTLAQLRRNLARDKAQLAAAQPPALPAAAAVTALRRRWVLPSLGMAAAIVMTTGTGLLAWQHWQAQPVFKQAYARSAANSWKCNCPMAASCAWTLLPGWR